MIHFFNKRELITTFSYEQLYRIKSALEDANIPYRTKSVIHHLSSDRYRGIPFINSNFSHPIVIYVKASDYEIAETAIQNVL